MQGEIKMKLLKRLIPILIFCVSIGAIGAAAQTNEFTYQGKLTDAGAAANGQYDFTFRLFDAPEGGTRIGTDFFADNVPVSGGIFTLKLDFGASSFSSGTARFLEISVRTGASTGAFTTLTPRQQITSAPFSVKSLNATTADNVSGIVPIANGGTGSSTQNFVDLSTDQTVVGNKTFTGVLSGNGSGLINLNSTVFITTVSQNFTIQGGNFATGTANCPGDYPKVTGGGYETSDNFGRLLAPIQSRPTLNRNGWQVRLVSSAQVADTFTVYAICAK